MRPKNLKTKIFLDSGSAEETREALKLLGFLDGQTTNPTYFSKNPKIQERLKTQGKFSREEVYASYRQVVQEVSRLIPDGSVSVEVYADKNTTAKEMLKQGREMFSWIPNAHIKFPTIPEGLKAAEQAVSEGLRVNMTLVFSQGQAAAVYAATRGAKRGQVFVSPFVGRLFDRGENGIDLIANIIQMYRQGDGHVEVLTASLRQVDQFYAALHLGTDIITSGLKYLQEWQAQGLKLPSDDFTYQPAGLRSIPYQEITLNRPYREYDIRHELTDVGLQKFADDWNNLMQH